MLKEEELIWAIDKHIGVLVVKCYLNFYTTKKIKNKA